MLYKLYYWIFKYVFRLEYLLEAIFHHILIKLKGSNYKNRIIYQSDIGTLINKIKKNEKKRLALFVAFHDKRYIPQSNHEYIKFLANCDFIVVYIHNGKLNKDVIEKLNNLGCYLICRKNIGQDFGAWKDSLEMLEDYKINNLLRWILICNDSNFCINGSNLNFIKKFEKNLVSPENYDFLSLNCNFELNLHYQSYFLCFGQQVFRSKIFKNFWRNYLPLNHRYHSIKRGEKKLSDNVLSNFKSKVILNNHDLYHLIINESNQNDFRALLSLFPKNQIFLEKCFLNNSFNSGLLKMLGVLESYNPSHIFALTNIYFLNSPFIKKDIVRFGLYSLNQIHEVLSSSKLELKKEIIEELMSYFTSTGTIYSYKENLRKAIRKGVPKTIELTYNAHLESRLLIDPEASAKKALPDSFF